MGVRVLLDTNVWRYVVDSGRLATLEQAARKSRTSVVIAPAVLYEVALTVDPVMRRDLLRTLILPAWKRLMPEAYSEAEEISLEVRRLEPKWLRPVPNMVYFNQLRHDWKRSRGGAWDRTASDPLLIRRCHSPDLNLARKQASNHRQESIDWSPKWRTEPLSAIRATLTERSSRWAGEKIEPWRIEGLDIFVRSLRCKDHATKDWLMGAIDLDLMLNQFEELTRFWLFKVEAARMPRHWLRWAFGFKQRLHKVSPGTPGDNQLSSYLTEVDVFLSADKTLIRISEMVRQDAPFRVAEGLVVPAGEPTLDAVLDVIGQSRSRLSKNI